MVTPDEFEETWLPRLSTGAEALFRHVASDGETLSHTAAADAFVASLGLKPIGYNWELLDASASAAETRSALGELVSALSHRLSNPGKPWLPEEAANQCARDFLSLFDSASLTVVSNRYDGLWHPIAGGEVEWGFVGFDRETIALLLLTAK